MNCDFTKELQWDKQIKEFAEENEENLIFDLYNYTQSINVKAQKHADDN